MIIRFTVSNVTPSMVAEGLVAFGFKGGTLIEGQGWWHNPATDLVEYEPNVTAEVADGVHKYQDLLDCIQNMLCLLGQDAAYLTVITGTPVKPGAYLLWRETGELEAAV